jgi:hypothetical protein
MKRLDFAIDLRLLCDLPHQSRGFDRRRHTAQFVLNFTVQNLNRQSKGYGDYYWFGITFYDSRRAVTSPSALPETGTDKFIYDVGIAPFTSQVIGAGKWVSIRGDLLPHMRTGLQEAWRRGYLAGSRDAADYRIGDVNIGWEITGLNEAAMAMKAFSTRATLK